MTDQSPTQGTDPRDDTSNLGRRSGAVMRLIAFLAGAVLVLDQGTKILAETFLHLGSPVPLIGNVLRLQLTYNPGAAFSIGTGATWLLSLIMVVVIVIVVRLAPKIRSTAWAWAFGLLLGGALGNLGDRLFRAPGFPNGHVVDFIDYGWFVGNIADIAIVAAAAVIIVLSLRGVGIDGARPSANQQADDES